RVGEEDAPVWRLQHAAGHGVVVVVEGAGVQAQAYFTRPRGGRRRALVQVASVETGRLAQAHDPHGAAPCWNGCGRGVCRGAAVAARGRGAPSATRYIGPLATGSTAGRVPVGTSPAGASNLSPLPFTARKSRCRNRSSSFWPPWWR